MRSMASSSSNKGIAAIVGVGPKLGRTIARKFAHEGYTVAILARDLGRLSRFADEIAREEKSQVFAIRIDCSDSRSVREAFEGVLSLGFVEVLVYNAYQPAVYRQPTNFTHIPADSFEKSLAVSSVGAFLCAQQVLPGMVERGKGTILFTGCSASLNGIAGFSELCKNFLYKEITLFKSFISIYIIRQLLVYLPPTYTGCGKFALRALSQCLASEFQSQGVHVAHVIIDGVIGPPRGPSSSQKTSVGEQQQEEQGMGGIGEMMMDPDSLAQTYWHLHVQDRTAWTQEIDLRPSYSINPGFY
ncbi:hypothetical protein H0E87_010551 [Populus deltoides]|uniref:Uncharacterized protein n=1 Tax=Populus deltoides TaxID=3696 RepID=A0A8T2YTI4_POPDE|nr:hypothetical protein H0E87_010551 [Populus deltoides]